MGRHYREPGNINIGLQDCRMSVIRDNKGFTLLELLISTTVFSVILLLCTFGLIQVGRNYYRGATITRTQNVARSVMSTLTQSIQFSGSDYVGTLPSAVSTSGQFCIGSLGYTYRPESLKTSECSGGLPSANNQTELLGKGMSLRTFTIEKSGDYYTIDLLIAYGEADLLNNQGLCKGGAGSQFCATSSLKTTVHRRLK